ncbi:hypothetical protein HN51_044603, partial [Arachis hypogaea]
VALVLLLALRDEVRVNGYGGSEQCEYSPELAPRPPVTLEETINKLQSENEREKQNQASLEMRIAQLQSENSSLLEKEVGLEMRIAQLESEKSSLLQKEVGLVEETKWLLSEKEFLSLKVGYSTTSGKLRALLQGIIHANSDLELRPLWSRSSSRSKTSAYTNHNLLAVPVGIKQKYNVDAI